MKGQYAYILNYVGILALILNLGIGQSYTFFRKNIGERVKQDYVNIFYYQLYIYILIILIINLFLNNKVLNIILVASILAQFNSQVAFMALVININKRNVITIFTTLLYTITLFYIYFFTEKNLEYVIIAYVFRVIVDIVIIIIKNQIYPTTIFIDVKFLKKILKFSFFPMVTSLLIVFNYSIDIIILKQFVSFNELGIYSVGVALAGMLWLIPDAFKDVLFNRTAKNDSIEQVKFGIKFNVYLSTIIIIGFTLFGKQFLNIIYGQEYIGAYSVSLLLFLGCIPMIFFKMINTLYISIGNQKFAFYILMIAVFGNIIANYLLIPIRGIEGAAIASVISYSICGIIFLVSFIKKYNIKAKDIIFLNVNERSKLKSILKKRN